MEENSEPNIKGINEKNGNPTDSNSEVEKVSKSDKINNQDKESNLTENINDSKISGVAKVEIKKNDQPTKPIPKQKKETPRENLEPSNKENNEKTENPTSSNSEVEKVSKSDKINNQDKESNLTENVNDSKISSVAKVEIKKNDQPTKPLPKPKKEPPIEKKPFQEFINLHLIPGLIEEINKRGLEVNNINFENTKRPIAGDKCWVINCEIKETCSFWLSFDKEDISSSKSISLSKPNQKPSIIESFLIDEKRITLKLIISRVIQRLNGQKLIGIN